LIESQITFLKKHFIFKAEYQITRDQQKLRVAREIEELENLELDDETKLQE
jgi:hypothetical protein